MKTLNKKLNNKNSRTVSEVCLKNRVSPYPTIMDVPLKYRLTLQGKYNAKVNWCVECDEYFDIDSYKDLGFAEQGGHLVLIMECQKCWVKQYHHIKTQSYLETVLLKFNLSEGEG